MVKLSRSNIVQFFVLGFFCVTGASAQIEEAPIPNSMAALGDSMTAGALAGFSRQNANLPWLQSMLVIKGLMFGITGKTRYFERRDLSWATGSNPGTVTKSHARRIASLPRAEKLKVYNAAVSGTSIEDVLLDQVPDMFEWSFKKLNKPAPDYVTVLIGANDACAKRASEMTTVSSYHLKMESIVHQVLVRSPTSRILLANLPNIEKLRTVAKDAKLIGWGPLKKCKDLWKLTKMCPTLTLIDDPTEREIVSQRIKDYNQVMVDVANRAREEYGDRIRVSNKIYNTAFTADHLAVDCFHPNATGQDLMSRVTWDDAWWAGLHAN